MIMEVAIKALIISADDFEDTEVLVPYYRDTSRQPSDLPAFMRETLKKLRG